MEDNKDLNINDLNEVIDRIATKENISNPDVKYRYSAEKGTGFLGEVSGFDIQGDNKTLNLIIKAAPKKITMRQNMPIHKLYQRETFFYDTLIHEFQKFAEKKNIEQFNCIPKCHATSTVEYNEYLIMENLIDSGYEMYDKNKTMDDEHIRFLLKLYAKFHALSYAMRDQNIELFNKLANQTDNLTEEVMSLSNFFQVFVNLGNETKDIFKLPEEQKCYDAFCKFLDGIKDFMYMYEPDEYSVFLHGDCWFYNMLFKYDKETRRLQDVKLIDFQVVRLLNPVYDLAYFFYISASKEAMDKLDIYLKLYHDTLSSEIRKLGSDPESLYPYEKLREHWKKYSKIGLIISFLLKMMLCKAEEAIDLSSATGDEFVKLYSNQKFSSDDLYRIRIRDIIWHFYEKEFL